MGILKGEKKVAAVKFSKVFAIFLAFMLLLNGSGITVFAEGLGAQLSDMEEEQEPDVTEVSEPDATEEPEIVAGGDWGETVHWTLDSDGVLMITQDEGVECEYLYDEEPWEDYATSITKIVWGANCVSGNPLDSIPAIRFGTTYNGENFDNLKEIVFGDNVDMSLITDMSDMFSGCNNLVSLDVSKFDTSNVTDMSGMFSGCNSLKSLDVSGFNTKKVKNMSRMFSGCSSLTSLDVSGFNTENVSSLSQMFEGCSGLTGLDVSSFDTLGVEGMFKMFSGCSNLTSLDVSRFETGSVMVLQGMFADCSSLTSLDVSGFETDVAINMSDMFSGCSNLRGLDVSKFDTGNVSEMREMFADCSSLVNIDLSNFDTSNTIDMRAMFTGCSGLRKLDLSSFNMQYITDASAMLPEGDVLYEINAPINVKCDIALTGEWVRLDTNTVVTVIPQKLSESVILKRTDVAPPVDATKIILNQSDVTVEVQEAYQLLATIEPADATNKQVQWSSSDESIATVSATGLVTAHNVGTATITAKALGGQDVETTCKVTVVQMATGLKVTLDKSLNRENAYILVANEVVTPILTWENGDVWPEVSYSVSGDTAIIEDGKLIPQNAGGGVLTVTAKNGKKTGPTASINYHVYAEYVSGISLNENQVVLDAQNRESFRLEATIDNSDAACSKVEFSVDNPNVVQLIECGTDSATISLVEGAVGTAVVTATALDGSGKSASCMVMIGKVVDAILVRTSLEKDADGVYLLEEGKTAKFTADILPADATVKTVKWFSDDENIVKVDQEGNVTGIKSGVTYVCAQAMDGTPFIGVCEVRVTRPATAMKLEFSGISEGKVALRAPEEECIFRVNPVLTGADGETDGVLQNVEYALSGKGAKSVICLGDGVFRAIAPGEVTITVTAKENVKLKKSVKIAIVQHVYAFDVQAPKNIGSYQAEDGEHWIAYVGAKDVILTPIVIYNQNNKEYPANKEYKNYEFIFPENANGILSVDKKGTGIVVAKNAPAGSYEATIMNEDSNISETVFIDVVAAKETYIKAVKINLPKTIAAVEDGVQPIAEGSKVKLAGVLNGGEKTNGYTVTWNVEGKEGNAGAAAISKVGVLDLSTAKAGDIYTVSLTISKGEASKTATLEMNVTKKTDASALNLVLAENESEVLPASFNVQYANNGKVYKVATQSGAANLYSVTGGKKGVLSLEETEDGYIVRAESTGSAKITITALDGSNIKKSFTVKVVAASNPVSKVTVKSRVYYIEPGNSIAIPYSISTKNGKEATDTRIEWTSSDEGILRVATEIAETAEASCITTSDKGYLTLVPTNSMTGKVTLTGKALDGSKKSVKVTINVVSSSKKEMTRSLSLQIPAKTPNGGVSGLVLVTHGKSVKLTANVLPNKAKNKTISYTIIGVDQNGNRTLSEEELSSKGITIKKGVVTVSKKSSYTGFVRVIASLDYKTYLMNTAVPVSTSKILYVQPAVTKVEITDETGKVIKTASAEAGNTLSLNAKVTGAGELTYANVSWSVSNSKIARVDKNGFVTIKADTKRGKKIKVTATALDGSKKKAVVTITVK